MAERLASGKIPSIPLEGLELVDRLAGRAMGETGLALFPVDVIHAQNLDRVREHLKTGSLLIYANHFDRFDALVYGKIIKDNVSSLDKTMVLAAMKYLDPKRESEHKKVGKMLQLLSKGYGFNLLPIVQDSEEEKQRYPNFNEINKRSFIQTVRALRTPGSAVFIAPEGTRSQTGELLQGKESFETLLKAGGEKVLAIPLAAFPPIKIGRRTRVSIGEPFTYSELLEEQRQKPGESLTDLAMKRLATSLPEQNRGYYS